MELRNKKTGKRGTLALNNNEGEIEIVVLEPDMPLCGNSVLARYDSLAELNEEWEDYAPKEPLIKDEKIRKAVRAWAEALNASEVSYNSCAEYSEGRFEAEMGMADIDFGRVIGLEDGNYTIAELCGEEEE